MLKASRSCQLTERADTEYTTGVAAKEHMQRFSETRIFFLSLLPHLMFALEIEHIRGAAQHDPHQIHMELKNMSGGTGGMLAK